MDDLEGMGRDGDGLADGARAVDPAEGTVGKADCPEELKLENQLCFPLYACAKGVVRSYTPLLEPLGLTYTQYVCMMVLWERGEATQRELCRLLHLDSGTLSPLLRRLEAKGLLSRRRDAADERVVAVRLTDAGRALRDRAVEVPRELGRCIDLSPEDTRELYRLLHRLLDSLDRGAASKIVLQNR